VAGFLTIKALVGPSRKIDDIADLGDLGDLGVGELRLDALPQRD
jgi:hypothetical protein